MTAVHETMAVEGICPRCGDEAVRDEVDVGVGIMTGPWGCSCGWSESEEYDLRFRGGFQPGGGYRDPQGGFWPEANPVVQMMRRTERPPQDEDTRARQAIEGTRHEDI